MPKKKSKEQIRQEEIKKVQKQGAFFMSQLSYDVPKVTFPKLSKPKQK